MAQLHPYLNFNGNCREAMTFYQNCLGGDLQLMPYEGSPMAVSEEDKQKIMHATLKSGELYFMAADTSSAHTYTQGNSVVLSINCHSDEEIEGLFAKLSEGGNVTMPLATQFWGAVFGMLTDKFGMHWLLNYDKNPAE